MLYYCDPSYYFMLTQNDELKAQTQIAENDMECPASAQRNNPATGSEIPPVYEQDEISLQAFPNPFSDELNIVYKLPPQSISASLKIIEPAGRVVLSVQLDIRQNSARLSGLQLPNGVYICSVTTDTGLSRQFKLISIR
jgi:hypothetical protein